MTRVNREQFEEHVSHVVGECFDRRSDQPSFLDNVAQNLDFGLTDWSSLRSSPMNIELALSNAMDKVWDQIVQDSIDAPEIAYKNYYGSAPIDGVDGPSLQVCVLSSQTSGGWTFHTDVSLIPIKAAITPQVFSTEEVKKNTLFIEDDGRTNWPGTKSPTVQLHVKPGKYDAEPRLSEPHTDSPSVELDVKMDEKENNLSINESLSAAEPYFGYDKYRGPYDPTTDIFDPTTQLYVTKDENPSRECSATDDELRAKIKDADIRQRGQFEAIKDKYPDLKLPKEERMARGKTDPVLDRLDALEHDLTEVIAALVSKNIMRSY